MEKDINDYLHFTSGTVEININNPIYTLDVSSNFEILHPATRASWDEWNWQKHVHASFLVQGELGDKLERELGRRFAPAHVRAA